MEMEEDFNLLIDEIIYKNKHAFGKLYDLTIQNIYVTIHFLMDNKEDVQDVIQETYLQVYKNLKKFDKSKPFKPWITGIAIKQVQSYRRKKWRKLRLLKKVQLAEASKEMSMLDERMERVINDEFEELIQKLPFKQKQVVILHYFHEYSQEEVATILQIPIGTVKSRIHAALTSLRKEGHENYRFIEKVRNVQ